ncbi:MAG: aspartate dehydrogenase [Alphaproteobacteria bacterium]
MAQIAMIGFGAVGQYAARALSGLPEIEGVSVLCRPGREEAARAALWPDIEIASSIETLSRQPDCVVDCGGHPALEAHGAAVLRNGIDLITVSIGALADDGLAERLEAAAREGGARLELVSGAVGAIDALAAARIGGLDSVRYTGRKPPAGWAGSAAEDRLDLASLTEAAVHFDGTAREAARLYPKNANVAATVALAGLGLDATKAVLIADPNASGNIHEVEAVGAFGRFTFQIEGKPLPDNPKSSALTAMSVVRAVRNRVSAIAV